MARNMQMARMQMARMQMARTRLGALAAAIFLSSCAAPVPQSAQLPQWPAGAGAQPAFGRVVSIRSAMFPAGQSAGIAGVNAVLTALGQETVAPPVAGEEIVIQKTDGNPASLAQQSQSNSLQIGARVVVVEGAPLAIIGRN